MGLAMIAPAVDVVVIVDVLSFTTCVDVAIGRGAEVFPYQLRDGNEEEFAAARDAVLAAPRRDADSLCLSPSSLAKIAAGTRIVLPSPNGSALAFAAANAGVAQVVAACIRNGAAVGSALADEDLTVGVIAAGEKWGRSEGPLRVAVEDLLGAGAVLCVFDRVDLSPEARVAVAAWHDAEPELRERLLTCTSGRELLEAGWADDVEIAAQAHVSDLVPTLQADRFVAA